MSKYKRLELYLWWKCNQRCIFCIEWINIEKYSQKKISNSEILKKLIKYKKIWFNHVTFLWWEPFIQENFLFSLKSAHKLWYTILVTTNWTVIQNENLSKKYLTYIDQLIISINAINKKSQNIISWISKNINYSKIFNNIKKHWKWNFLKINTIVNKINLNKLNTISNFIIENKNIIDEISYTYPEILTWYYSKNHIENNILTTYTQWFNKIKKEIPLLNNNWINIKIVDYPFCILKELKYIKITDDYCYDNRIKINDEEKLEDREKILPRRRKHIDKCKWCKYIDTCWWPLIEYIDIIWDKEINKF